ncbi:hypothetical protein AB0A74_41485 [Saccharothrix sp. NPDC042600]|uniref:hypothetical protein n=1 Tax=Saccharothrix TaxID=2071 RepID=UPI0033E6F716|nr:hypothetical protein GCM10017745_31720 [Saccharothrix mutabilis subsp. capreolus]
MRALPVLSLSLLVAAALSGPHTPVVPPPAPVGAQPPATTSSPTTPPPALADPTPTPATPAETVAVAVPAGQPAGTAPVDGESVAERNARIPAPRPPLLTYVQTPTHIPTIYNGGPTTVPPTTDEAPAPQPQPDPNPTATTQPPTP